MNKYEVGEIKKAFSSTNGFFTLNRLFVNIISGDGEIKHTINKSGALLNTREEDMYYGILKSMLSTKVGKNLIQYDFNKEAYNKGHAYDVLHNVVETGFNSDVENKKFIQNIIDNYASDVPYAVVAAHCTYTIRHRDKLGILPDQEDEEYKFIISALCPVVSVDSGFSYNNQTGEFSTESDPKLYIQSKPTDGFLYPAFDDRSPNVNSVMYYCKKSSEAKTSIISDVLECPFVYTADQEKEMFQYIIQHTFGEKANYMYMYLINNALWDVVEQHKTDTRLYDMAIGDFYDILNTVDISADELKVFDYLYQQYIGDNRLKVDNLVENTIKLKTSEYTISFSKSVGDKVSTMVHDGARAIKLSTEDAEFEVNGTTVHV